MSFERFFKIGLLTMAVVFLWIQYLSLDNNRYLPLPGGLDEKVFTRVIDTKKGILYVFNIQAELRLASEKMAPFSFELLQVDRKTRLDLPGFERIEESKGK